MNFDFRQTSNFISKYLFSSIEKNEFNLLTFMLPSILETITNNQNIENFFFKEKIKELLNDNNFHYAIENRVSFIQKKVFDINIYKKMTYNCNFEHTFQNEHIYFEPFSIFMLKGFKFFFGLPYFSLKYFDILSIVRAKFSSKLDASIKIKTDHILNESFLTLNFKNEQIIIFSTDSNLQNFCRTSCGQSSLLNQLYIMSIDNDENSNFLKTIISTLHYCLNDHLYYCPIQPIELVVINFQKLNFIKTLNFSKFNRRKLINCILDYGNINNFFLQTISNSMNLENILDLLRWRLIDKSVIFRKIFNPNGIAEEFSTLFFLVNKKLSILQIYIKKDYVESLNSISKIYFPEIYIFNLKTECELERINQMVFYSSKIKTVFFSNKSIWFSKCDMKNAKAKEIKKHILVYDEFAIKKFLEETLFLKIINTKIHFQFYTYKKEKKCKIYLHHFRCNENLDFYSLTSENTVLFNLFNLLMDLLMFEKSELIIDPLLLENICSLIELLL